MGCYSPLQGYPQHYDTSFSNGSPAHFLVSANFRLKIFLSSFLDYRVLYFIRVADMSICLVLVFIVLIGGFVRKITKLFKGKF